MKEKAYYFVMRKCADNDLIEGWFPDFPDFCIVYGRTYDQCEKEIVSTFGNFWNDLKVRNIEPSPVVAILFIAGTHNGRVGELRIQEKA